MKYSYAALGIIMAGLVGVVFIGIFQAVTTNNESEYYVLKEALEASMLESVDMVCYRNNKEEGCGEVIKISEQKFVENFTRRFAESITGDANEYEILFYDIIESPPKASIAIVGKTQEYTLMSDESFDLANALSGILEYKEMITLGTEGYDETYQAVETTVPSQNSQEGTLNNSELSESGESACVIDDNGTPCPFDNTQITNPEYDVEEENVTEKLKATNQLEWVQKMNNIKNRAEEIVLNELIYN